MKIKNVFPLTAMFLAVLSGSCAADDSTPAAGASRQSTNAAKNAPVIGQLTAVNLRTAADYAVLSKTGITNVYPSVITGNIGSSPITGAAILLTCPEVNGTIYAVDAAGPACQLTDASRLTIAVGDMQTAYTNAAGRNNPNYLNVGAGNVGGQTLTPGLYKWTGNVTIPTDITLIGDAKSIFIFQVSGTLDVAPAVTIHLSGGARADNIVWQVSENVTLGTTSHFEGSILGHTLIALHTGASVNGRLLAQTAVTLQSSTVSKPN